MKQLQQPYVCGGDMQTCGYADLCICGCVNVYVNVWVYIWVCDVPINKEGCVSLKNIA